MTIATRRARIRTRNRLEAAMPPLAVLAVVVTALWILSCAAAAGS